MKTKKYALVCLTIVLALAIANFSLTKATDPLTFSHNDKDLVEKTIGEAFTVKINFKNTGSNQGNWSVNVTFEGDSWSWTGTSKNLTLGAGETKALTWNGAVPTNAKIGSMARLVVYYNDSFKALDWWIQVVPDSELTITSSCVE
jgi:hypothetical protein